MGAVDKGFCHAVLSQRLAVGVTSADLAAVG